MAIQVVFEVGGQFFGMNGSLVVSVENITASYALAGTPEYCEGVVKFRGELVPIVSMRKLFGINRGVEPKLSQVIIMRCKLGCIGYRVDQVIEIGEVSLKDMQVIPVVATRGATAYAMGVVRHNKMLVVITDQDRIVPHLEMDMILAGVNQIRSEEAKADEGAANTAEAENVAGEGNEEVKQAVEEKAAGEGNEEVKKTVEENAAPEKKVKKNKKSKKSGKTE